MGRDVSGVSRIEGRQDILLSTPAEYPAAAGVQAAAITVTVTVTVNGLDYSFDLTHVEAPEREIRDA